MSLLGHHKVIPVTCLDTLDHLFLSSAANKQTDKQTDGLKDPTHTDRHSRHISALFTDAKRHNFRSAYSHTNSCSSTEVS